MTPAERRQRQLDEIRAAAAEVAATFPPLTARQIERLAFLLAPTVAAPRTAPKQTTPIADAA